MSLKDLHEESTKTKLGFAYEVSGILFSVRKTSMVVDWPNDRLLHTWKGYQQNR